MISLHGRGKTILLASVAAALFAAHALGEFIPDALGNLIAAFALGYLGGVLTGLAGGAKLKK